jgi:hypothetical protein
LRTCGCPDSTGNHRLGCELRTDPECANCGSTGHTARTCEVDNVRVVIKMPKKMVEEIDKFAAALERPYRKNAILRLLTEALVVRLP